ncbi:hypothetical protein [Bacillus sp. FJAT-27445]|uniref:hypothetical protein n=1 Tax=Bacillus sp. FJAT-27445 TaxID=1679166 RepID=UPI000743AF42|nr:hypothetical protein [Bacillus sp. FJAT-27445]
MELDSIYDIFVKKAGGLPGVASIEMKKIAGIPFLFIYPAETGTRNGIEKGLRLCSSETMKGKRLSSETVFVRSDASFLVFRHRFFVPQRKMFCCGNLCLDCVRFVPDRFF